MQSTNLTSAKNCLNKAFIRRVLLRLILLTSLWFLLVGGNSASLVVGIVVIPLAIGLSLIIVPASSANFRIRLPGILRFIPYFFYQSIYGGWDTAKRALNPGLPIRPARITYQLKLLSQNASRRFFMNVVSLMPGSLSITLNDVAGTVEIHALNKPSFSDADLHECERRIADLFGEAEGDN